MHPHFPAEEWASVAVLSAEYVLEQIYKEDAAEMIEEFEDKFKVADKGSVMCSDLRRKVEGSCRACVRDAAKILEEMILEVKNGILQLDNRFRHTNCLS